MDYKGKKPEIRNLGNTNATKLRNKVSQYYNNDTASNDEPIIHPSSICSICTFIFVISFKISQIHFNLHLIINSINIDNFRQIVNGGDRVLLS